MNTPICKCGSYAINDDPNNILCDRCWRDAKLVTLMVQQDELIRVLTRAGNILCGLGHDIRWIDNALAEAKKGE